MENLVPEVQIVGEVEAGKPAKVRKQINALIKGMNSNTFDLAELLHEVKSKKYFEPWGYDTFSAYAKELDLKPAKSYYLVRMVEVMNAASIPRATYEPVGIAKLRFITALEPSATAEVDGQPKPMVEAIKGIVDKAKDLTLDEIKTAVSALQGLTGDDAIVWVNFAMKHSAREIWRKAVELARKNIGSVGKDAEGMAKDASEGACAEVLAIDYINDPNNNYDMDQLKKDDLFNKPAVMDSGSGLSD